MFTCINQSCGADWRPSDVDIHDEGQGLLFRCPMCGARNHVKQGPDSPDGTPNYRQISKAEATNGV